MEKSSKTNSMSLVEVISTLSDLVVFNHIDFDTFLKKLIAIVTKVVAVDSCLIYFYDRDRKHSILIGSKKPHKNELGHIVIEKGVGITGWVVEHKKTVAIEKGAYKDVRFKYFKELPEDRYEAFLSVPVLDERGVVGVINLQNKLPYSFTKEQIAIVESLVKIIASAFESVVLTRKVDYLESKLEERKIVEQAKGILMRVRNLSEEEAYHFMRKEAMQKRKTLREIAEAFLLVYSS
jgi:uroporphyrinogen-III synthase